MSELVITDENIKQEVRISRENIKSNQHRIVKVEDVVEDMVPKVTKIYDFLEERKAKVDKNMKVYMVVIAIISLLPSLYLMFFN